MRVGCGSATIGIFAQQWHGHVDEVVVVDDHITGVLTEHQAGRFLDMPPTGIRCAAASRRPAATSRSPTPAPAGAAPTSPIRCRSSKAGIRRAARPGLRLLMVSTTGEDAAWFVLDEQLCRSRRRCRRRSQRVVERIGENCEPALSTVLFVAGAGGSLRAGVTENPVRLTRSIKDLLVNVTCGGAPVYVWPGGGITLMVDVARMPDNSLRLGADAGDRRADRVHACGSRTTARSAATWTACGGSRTCWPGAATSDRCGSRSDPWPPARAAVARSHERPPQGDGHGARSAPGWPTAAGISSTARSTASSAPTATPARDARARAAWQRFGGVLAELVDELPLLRTDRLGRRRRGPPARRRSPPHGRGLPRRCATGASSPRWRPSPARSPRS